MSKNESKLSKDLGYKSTQQISTGCCIWTLSVKYPLPLHVPVFETAIFVNSVKIWNYNLGKNILGHLRKLGTKTHFAK